jgi:NAD+ synthase
LKKSYQKLLRTLKKNKVVVNDLVKANIKARLRMTTIYALGQAHQYLVLGTDNYDE